jgi:phytoene dehydrogenase-like protein
MRGFPKLNSEPVIIIGAGLAGLCCARRLESHHIPIILFEASDAVGGRVRTDKLDGFLLDRGFQVLQTAYPVAQAMLDYANLKLHPFEPGATIRTKNGWANMVDPGRRPGMALQTLFNGVGNFADRWRLLMMKRRLTGSPNADGPDVSTQEYLVKHCKFSSDFIDRFLRPWISGMFFDEELRTSSHFFQFVFRMLSMGDAAIPADGMATIPLQLASGLNKDSIRLNSPIDRIEGSRVICSSGEMINARAIVIATDSHSANRLTAGYVQPRVFGATTCWYFAADHSPKLGKLLALNGDKEGPISNVCVPSNVAPTYAPKDQSLICVSIRSGYLEEKDLENQVIKQSQNWFGATVDSWRFLRRYDIPRAIPFQAPGKALSTNVFQPAENVFLSGDYLTTPSINGAMSSGVQAAEAVLRAIHGNPTSLARN